MIEKIWKKRLRFGILPKMIVSFLFVSIVPLMVMGYFADKNLSSVGTAAVRSTEDMGRRNLTSATEIGTNAIRDSVQVLDERSTEAIELRTVELARAIADFLHERDMDILMLASLQPDAKRYLDIYRALNKDVVLHGPRPPQEGTEGAGKTSLTWDNPENKTAWHHTPPYRFRKAPRPLYREITFVDLRGHEQIKIRDGEVSNDLLDISTKENTYCRAEDYFSSLDRLPEGGIYVSRVIGPYVRGWLFKTEDGMKVKPESAYAGKENPDGREFEGIIRWATPVFNSDGVKIGYVTQALNHTHLMEFTDHIVPTEEGFSELPDGGSGNYAFLWDYQDKCISHARDFFIIGYDPETGGEVPGWLSQQSYDEYKRSGLSLDKYISQLPSFRGFSLEKNGSREQAAAGEVGLDCRVLDMAPQCQGWHTGTEDGGSGSFLIHWSGLWKLTTYATVPYYTGEYGNTKRGFGYVTLGANVEDFHKAANVTKATIEHSIREQGELIREETEQARQSIRQSAVENGRMMTIISLISVLLSIGASVAISLTITRPLRRLTEGAAAMGRGDLNQYIDVKTRDETGRLADTFNEMAATLAVVDRMKSEFVTTASHELRTPIHSMLLGVSGLLGGYGGEISDEAREDLLVVQEGIDRLRRLVDNLLDLSRIESRKSVLSVDGVEVEDVIDTALDELAGLVEAHRHQVVKHISKPFPTLTADRDRLIQLLVNLLSNSIKYTPDNGKILITAEHGDANITLSVADNGYGIPWWARKKVFERFFQADQVMSQRVGGSGLGLTICRWIVEEHGGSIDLLSPLPEKLFPGLDLGRERKGTAFFVHLPLVCTQTRS